MAQTPATNSQVRWLIAGPLGFEPSGKIFSVNRADFNEWLEAKNLSIEVNLEDGLGQGGRKTYSLSVGKLRDLTLKEIVNSNFSKLLDIAGSSGSAQETYDAVVGLVGSGPLSQKIAEIGELKIEAEKPAEMAAKGSNGDVVDSIFETAEAPTPEKSTASSAIDAFVRNTKGSKKVRRSKSSRKIRDAIEQAVYVEAKGILDSEEVRRVEEPLRGLHFFVNQCPKSSGIQCDFLDVPLDQVDEAISDIPRGDLVDEPDAVFIPFALDDPALLGRLAELAEAMMYPIVVDVAPSVLGYSNTDAMVEALEEIEPKNADAAWLSLRQEESSRWLCAISNGVVLASEGTGVARRERVGSGVWALAAIVSQSYAKTGSFARVSGQVGALSAPAVRTLESGRFEGMAAPTEVFIPIRGQTKMAQHGFLALGSARNSDRIVLVEPVMTRASADAVPLPAQILTGRLVRFSMWVRDQLPKDSDADTARNMFREAAKVFLFPGMSEVGEVDATIREEDGERVFQVYANIVPSHAGIPFELAFPLSLES